MSTVIGLFTDSKKAGDVVGQLKSHGYTDSISVVSKGVNQDGISSDQVKQDLTDGATTGAVAGATLGALGALLAGVASFVVPGVGFVVLGPLATFLAGTAGGAVAGGMVGALVDWGIPEEKAKDYEDRINRGEVLVAVTADNEKEQHVKTMLDTGGASETYISEK